MKNTWTKITIKACIMNTCKQFFLLVLLGCSSLALAQRETHRPAEEKIEAYRAQFLTEQLDLSPEEAQKFWPVYNEYRKELEEIRSKRPAGNLRGRPGEEALDEMSDTEIQKMMESEMARQQQLLDLRKKYYQKFREVLPIRKVAQLYRAEIEFQRRLIRRLGERNHPRH